MIRKHQTIRTAPAVAAGVLDRPMKMEEACEIFEEYRELNFPVNRPTRYKKSREKVTYEPQEPLTPWYLDPQSGGLNPAPENRKPGIKYEND